MISLLIVVTIASLIKLIYFNIIDFPQFSSLYSLTPFSINFVSATTNKANIYCILTVHSAKHFMCITTSFSQYLYQVVTIIIFVLQV